MTFGVNPRRQMAASVGVVTLVCAAISHLAGHFNNFSLETPMSLVIFQYTLKPQFQCLLLSAFVI